MIVCYLCGSADVEQVTGAQCAWCAQAQRLADFVNANRPQARHPAGYPEMQPWQLVFISRWLRQDAASRGERPPQCQHEGGMGIGAGHVCYRVRARGHPIDSDRPHGCSCGALWADTCDVRIGHHATPHHGGGCMLR